MSLEEVINMFMNMLRKNKKSKKYSEQTYKIVLTIFFSFDIICFVRGWYL